MSIQRDRNPGDEMVKVRCGKTAAGEPEGKRLDQRCAESPGHGGVREEENLNTWML